MVPWKVRQYRPGILGLASSELPRRVMEWRWERRREVVELKGRQQQEMEGESQFHSYFNVIGHTNAHSHFCKFTTWRLVYRGLTVLQLLNWYHVIKNLQPHELQPTRLLCPWDFPGKNTGAGCHFLLQGIVPTQEIKSSCVCRWILYH